MTDQCLAVTTVVNARPQTVFDLLADPSTHASIDGTGWVRPIAWQPGAEPKDIPGYQVPPFPEAHLENSLRNLAALAEQDQRAASSRSTRSVAPQSMHLSVTDWP